MAVNETNLKKCKKSFINGTIMRSYVCAKSNLIMQEFWGEQV